MEYEYGYKSEETLVKGSLFGGSRTVGHDFIQFDLKEAS